MRKQMKGSSTLALIPLVLVLIIFFTSCNESRSQGNQMNQITANVLVIEKDCDDQCWIVGKVSDDELIKIALDNKKTWYMFELNELYTLSYIQEQSGRAYLREVVQ